MLTDGGNIVNSRGCTQQPSSVLSGKQPRLNERKGDKYVPDRKWMASYLSPNRYSPRKGSITKVVRDLKPRGIPASGAARRDSSKNTQDMKEKKRKASETGGDLREISPRSMGYPMASPKSKIKADDRNARVRHEKESYFEDMPQTHGAHPTYATTVSGFGRGQEITKNALDLSSSRGLIPKKVKTESMACHRYYEEVMQPREAPADHKLKAGWSGGCLVENTSATKKRRIANRSEYFPESSPSHAPQTRRSKGHMVHRKTTKESSSVTVGHGKEVASELGESSRSGTHNPVRRKQTSPLKQRQTTESIARNGNMRSEFEEKQVSQTGIRRSWRAHTPWPTFKLFSNLELQHDRDSPTTKVTRILNKFDELLRKFSDIRERSVRPDSKALKEMNSKFPNLVGNRMSGNIPGVQVGDWFRYRSQLFVIGLHKRVQDGIDYIKQTRRDGQLQSVAVSVVISGGYEGNKDISPSGDKLIYSGEGGKDSTSEQQVKDQKLTKGNLALSNCIKLGQFVRVIRNKGGRSGSASDNLYTYEGLYKVQGVKLERGKSGFNVYKFELQREGPI